MEWVNEECNVLDVRDNNARWIGCTYTNLGRGAGDGNGMNVVEVMD